jgi:hypothetical protein
MKLKNYHYRIIGTSIIDSTTTSNLNDLKSYVYSIHGKCKIEYWSANGKFSGNLTIN